MKLLYELAYSGFRIQLKNKATSVKNPAASQPRYNTIICSYNSAKGRRDCSENEYAFNTPKKDKTVLTRFQICSKGLFFKISSAEFVIFKCRQPGHMF